MRRYTATGRLLLLTLLLWSVPLYAYAQDDATPTPETPPTPTAQALTPTTEPDPVSPSPTAPPADLTGIPYPDYVLGATFDLIYPEALWSSFQLSIPPGQIRSATLTVAQEGWSAPPVSIDIADYLAVRPSEPGVLTDFDYLWSIPVENPPRLFEPLRLTWRFTRTNGQTDTLAEALPFLDPRTNWTRAISEAGDIAIALPSGLSGARALAEDLQQIRDLLRENTGTQPLALRLVVYTTSLPLSPCVPGVGGQPVAVGQRSTVTVPCRAETARALYDAAGYRIVELSINTREAVLDAGLLLLFEAAYAPLWAEQTVPAWFSEGLRRFYLPGPKHELRELARAAARTNGLLRSLDTRPTDPQRLALWEAQSYGLVLYMAEQLGVDGLFAVARGLGDGRSLDELLAQANGGSMTRLNAAWGNWVLSEAAASAYGYSPYLPTTPTPSLTPSLTATATRTFTATFTPSITPTVTGILTPTPGPTRTFTPTFTPSLTLRPADSLLTPTPQPAPAAGFGGGSDTTLLLLVGVAALAVVVLGGIGLVAWRRRG